MAQAFTVPTLNGNVTVVPGESGPLVGMAVDPADPFTATMLSDPASLQGFLTQSPPETQYMFMSYGAAAGNDVRGIQAALQAQMEALGFNQSTKANWDARLHFVTAPVAQLDAYIQGLLANWTSPIEGVQVTDGDDLLASGARLDSFYSWLNWPTLNQNTSAVIAGDPCGNFSLPNVANNVIVVQLDTSPPQECSWAEISLTATNVNAAGVVLILPQATPFTLINCTGADCALPASVSLSQVSYEDGQALLAALGASPTANFSYTEQQTNGFFFQIDELGLLGEVGWEKFTTLQFMSWSAQYIEYFRELRANLSRPALVVPAFNNTLMQGSGIVLNMTLPPLAVLQSFQHFELDFALGCPTPYEESCAVWDRTVELLVCGINASNIVGAVNHDENTVQPRPDPRHASSSRSQSDDPLCNLELGRWITAFRRGVGRWITDVTHILPLLTSQAVQIHVYTDAWAMPWYPSLNFRFRNDTPAEAAARGVAGAGIRPRQLLPLFQGGTFNSTYNNRSAILFNIPPATSRTYLYAVITGHGFDNNGCGEFCVTSHVFTINGHVNNITFWGAGSIWGCSETVRNGAGPNLHGTWNFGRDGWCDSNRVDPWVVDITDQLAGSGQTNTITYQGQFQGQTPDPTVSGGDARWQLCA